MVSLHMAAGVQKRQKIDKTNSIATMRDYLKKVRSYQNKVNKLNIMIEVGEMRYIFQQNIG